jgi:hypothetical protein
MKYSSAQRPLTSLYQLQHVYRWARFTPEHMAYCEIPIKEGSTKRTNRNSWFFRPWISSVREIQRDCLLLGDENHERRLEARVQALLETVDDSPPERVRPCDVQKIIKTLKLKKACGIDGIPNEILRHLPRRPLVHLTHLFNLCIRLSHFPVSWKEAKAITLPKPGKDHIFPQHLRPINLLSTTGKLFEKVILKMVERHLEERDLLNASQFGFPARHTTTLQCMRLTDHVTLNFNNNMSTAAVFLDIEKPLLQLGTPACYINYRN